MSTQKVSGGEVTFEVDSPSQYNQIPNDTYFKDNYLGIILYKNSSGTVVNPYTSSGSTTTETFELTQSDMRTLNSANSGYGFLIFNALGAGKFNKIISAYLQVRQTGGSESAGGSYKILSKVLPDSSVDYQSVLLSADLLSGGVAVFAEAGGAMLNQPMFLYGPADFADFQGSATLVIEYEETTV